MRYAYPYDQVPQPDGGWSVTFPDVPEAITEGDTEEEVAAMAEDALVSALSFYTDAGRPLPRPSAANGRPVARVPPLVAAKLALHDAMLADGVSNVVLGKRLGLDEKAVRRLRDPLYRSHIGGIETALRSLGRDDEFAAPPAPGRDAGGNAVLVQNPVAGRPDERAVKNRVVDDGGWHGRIMSQVSPLHPANVLATVRCHVFVRLPS